MKRTDNNVLTKMVAGFFASLVIFGLMFLVSPVQGQNPEARLPYGDEIFIQDLDDGATFLPPDITIPKAPIQASPPARPQTIAPVSPVKAAPSVQQINKTTAPLPTYVPPANPVKSWQPPVPMAAMTAQFDEIVDPYAGVPAMFRDKTNKPYILPSIKLENAPARIFLMEQLYGFDINVMIDPTIDCRVNLSLAKISLWSAVKRILDTCSLGWNIEDNIFTIDTFADINANKSNRTMIIRPYYVQYLKAEEVKQFILGETTIKTARVELGGSTYSSSNDGEETASNTSGLLSAGSGGETPSVVADESTNCIIIKDEPENVNKIIALVKAMDHPRPQIKIQTWIVETKKTVARQLGLRWSATWDMGTTQFFAGSRDPADGSASQFRYPLEGISRGIIPPQEAPTDDGYVNYEHESSNTTYDGNLYSLGFGATTDFGSIVAELQALESAGDLRILSRPELVLQDNREAVITQGQEIHQTYYSNNMAGSMTIDAKLEVKVKPHITPNNSLVIDISLKDRYPEDVIDGDWVINEKGIETKLYVGNGQTVVLGGIRQSKTLHSSDGVPILKDIPLLGWLFKSQADEDELKELVLIMRPVIIGTVSQQRPVTQANR